MAEVHVVIPSRMASTRLPNKPLLKIAGKPMVQHVYENARAVYENVLVATDNYEVESAVVGFGGAAVMTSASCVSGTDRVGQVAFMKGWAPDDIVINLQGDEPLLNAEYLRLLESALKADPEADIATLISPIRNVDQFHNPNVVKAVVTADLKALYFSRAPIPFDRAQPVSDSTPGGYGHIGVYAYRVSSLLKFCEIPPSRSGLEEIEMLEQLRALEAGMRVVCSVIENAPACGVDTEEDLIRVRDLMES